MTGAGNESDIIPCVTLAVSHAAGGHRRIQIPYVCDGKRRSALSPALPLKTGNTLAKASSTRLERTLSRRDRKKAVGACPRSMAIKEQREFI